MEDREEEVEEEEEAGSGGVIGVSGIYLRRQASKQRERRGKSTSIENNDETAPFDTLWAR